MFAFLVETIKVGQVKEKAAAYHLQSRQPMLNLARLSDQAPQ